MKKFFVSLASAISYFVMPALVYAQTPQVVDPCTKDPNDPNANAIGDVICKLGGNIGVTLRNVVIFFVILAVIIALLYLLYGGIKWITSRGEKTEVEAARNHIIAAIVGLVVVFLSIFILSLALAAFGISFGDLKIPIITPK